jgi:hypothetical protein
VTYQTPRSSDLSLYLGNTVDDVRADLIIKLAEKLCLSIVNPLLDGAEAVVLDVAGRAYSNPQAVTSDATGPYLTTYGRGMGGLWLTRQNKATLSGLAGGGGAFTVDPMADDVSPSNVWAQVPLDPTAPGPYPPWNDFDQVPTT